jgi:hypothetical protein
MTNEFNTWWNQDLLTEDNPYVEGTPAFWAWEGWQAALAAPVQEPLTWYEGAPPFPQDQEWFIAETIYGDRVVLRSLDEGREHKGNYAFKTADQTYMKQEIVKRWMQFPDCEYLPPAQEFVCSTGLCHYKEQPALKPLTNEQVGKAARDAHIAFCLNKHQTYEHALTRAVEAAHGITGETK